MARRGLGRGLDALLQAPAADEEVRRLPLDRLRPNRRQPRSEFDQQALAELAASIKAQGLVQPIVVTPGEDGTYFIVAGERRFRACRLAGLDEVPVVVRAVGDDRELLELALVENLQRSDLNAVEEAIAYRALHDDFGLSQEEIARRVGKARPTIANAVRLLKLPPEVLDLMREGRLSAGQARPLLALDAPPDQLALARRAVEEGLTARDLEALTASPAAAAARRPRQPEMVDVHAAAAAEQLTRRLQTRVEIRRRARGGTVQIHFHSEEELIRLFDVLMDRSEAP